MARRWSALALAALMSTGLAACAGSDDPGTTEAVSDATSVLPSDLDSATSGDTDLDGEADAGAALTAEEFCGFLADETPAVIDLTPPEYAYATFGGALFNFYTSKGLLTDIDGADMDALAAQGCPDAAAELLPVLGASDFETLLSQ